MIRISNLELETGADTCVLRAQVDCTDLDESFTLWYQLPASAAPFASAENGDPFLAALLLPAMSTGEPLELHAPVSPKLLKSVDQLQDIFSCWYDSLSKVPIHAPRREPDTMQASSQRLNGLFFSLGADSFYSLLRNVTQHPDDDETINGLIVVHGFDIPVGRQTSGTFTQVVESSRQVASKFGKEVLPVATNIRDVMDLYVPWGDVGHGAALASVGLALEGVFQKVRIAGGFSYNNLHPSGTHPLTDPLWSTEQLSFVHDGAEASRLDKFRFISQFPAALEALRICFNSSEARNCGHCEKCIRSMLALHVAGGLQRCTTLPHHIDVERVRQLKVGTEHQEVMLTELAQALGNSDEERALEAALRESLDKGKQNRRVKDTHFFVNTAWARRARGAMRDLDRVIPEREHVILVDDEQCRHLLGTVRRTTPFLERGGQYNGPPPDDETAISEMERLREAGVGFIAFAWPAFWWLDHYTGLHEYLVTNFRCTLENDRLRVFDLRI